MKRVVLLFNTIKAFYRLIWLGLHFVYGLSLLLVYRNRWGKKWFYTQQGAKAVQKWFKQGSRILGLKIRLSGDASHQAVLVANHISWLDIVAIAASTPVTFVSKADLKSWPMIGKLAKSSGTVFIKRGSLFSLHHSMNQLVDILHAKQNVIFFPEGTTTRGESVKRFNSGLFETAYKSGSPVQPVAISYYRDNQADYTVAPYVDDDHFMVHLWNLLFHGKLHVQIDFLDEIEVSKFSRRITAELCQSRISEVLRISALINTDYPLESKDAAHLLIS